MLTIKHIKEFEKKGYTILNNGLNQQELTRLHEEADILTNYSMSEGYDIVKDLGCIIEPWTCGYLEMDDEEYKVNKQVYKELRDTIHPTAIDEVSSNLILNKYSHWATELLNTKGLYLLNEQFIIKPPVKLGQSEFAWHRDSDYYKDEGEIVTIACWTALDDINEQNGTLEIVDFEGTSFILQLKAGGVIFMSNQLLHKSAANTSPTFRRAFMAQFSTRPIRIGLSIKCTT